MELTADRFKENAREALADAHIQRAMRNVETGFIDKRLKAAGDLPEFDALRDSARDIKNHTLDHLDLYLEAYEKKVTAAGGHVHWAENAEEARRQILDICRKAGAKTVTKGKSMITEEIGLNEFLSENGITPVETDLGEYIIQLRGEHPSHIIAPAVHLNKDQVESDFRRVHTQFDPQRDLSEPVSLLAEARQVLRQKYFEADVGITGANFLVAETGTSVIVTNEGNGDLTQTLGKVHVVVASIEKIVPTLEDTAQILRVLARSATGQDMSVYTTFSTGPRRPEDPDGPDEYHVVLLDNGRSSMLGTEYQEMLRCIRCGACMNHCPVYHAVGGHAYGSVYPGPMGAVLTPSLNGIDKAGHLPNASTFCGRCEEVCPMRIPLPKMMRHWREREFERHLEPAAARYGLGVWAFFARRPRLYRRAVSLAMPLLGRLGGRRHRLRSLPLAGGWTRHRDLPAPEGRTFLDQWAARGKGEAMSARDNILAKVRRSLKAGEDAGRADAVRQRLESASARRHSGARASAGPRAHRALRAPGGQGQCHGRPRRRLRRRAGRRAQLPAREEPAGGSAHGRRPAARTGAMGHEDDARDPEGSRATASDAAGVSHALGGIAETGTLALTSGPDNPTTLNFLPEHHIVVVAASDIAPDLETLWQALREGRGDGSMPRTVNLVTGPSRSGDIEQVLLLGAHGPRAVHIVIVGGA